MRVVITGGAGFIGSNLTHHWIRAHPEDEVVVVDALTYAGQRKSLRDLEGNPHFSFVEANIGDGPTMDRVVRGAGTVINLAAETHNDRAIVSPLPFVTTNVLGTAALLESVRRNDVPRFHHVSTDEVFGSLALDDPNRFTESSPYRPRGPYSASKASSDHLVRAWTETYGLPATISNSGNNFGPYQHPEKLIPLAITRLIRGKKVPLYGDGQNVRDWIYVADHCGAIDLIVRRGRVGSTYLVSAGQELSNRNLLDLLLALFHQGPEAVEFVPDRPGHDRRYALDGRKLREELGWTPIHDFPSALRETVSWYRTSSEWWEPLLADETSKPSAPSGRAPKGSRTEAR
jgi:dTDP-glucose 4,6-dehydratase